MSDRWLLVMVALAFWGLTGFGVWALVAYLALFLWAWVSIGKHEKTNKN